MKTFILAIALLFVGACTKEEFVGSPRSESFVASPVEVFQNLTCANSTLVEPPVDILYIVDNSLSASYIGPVVRDQIRQTIQNISQEFDYRVVVAPLFPVQGSLPVITNNAAGIQQYHIIQLQDLAMFSSASGANYEPGFQRSREVISQNSGLFRSQAHTIIVLVSNGDDTTTTVSGLPGQSGTITDSNKMDNEFNQFVSLKNSLNAQQLRFFSLVAKSNCQSGWMIGARYSQMSQRLAQHNGSSSSDSYDLCASSYNLYSGINQSIRQQVVPHVYNRWLVTANNVPIVLESVHRMNSNGQATLLSPAQYSFSDVYGTQNTRIQPTVGEPKTGKFITLQPSAYLTYPDCLVVKTTTPTEYYGFAVVPTAPRPETLVVRVRGTNISQSSTNGFEYVGYRENQNIKVNQNGTTNNTNPINRTGYFIKLNGSAIYSSGETIEVFYTPAPI
jgi:hypothetical protein